jgi:hypothetical protein
MVAVSAIKFNNRKPGPERAGNRGKNRYFPPFTVSLASIKIITLG